MTESLSTTVVGQIPVMEAPEEVTRLVITEPPPEAMAPPPEAPRPVNAWLQPRPRPSSPQARVLRWKDNPARQHAQRLADRGSLVRLVPQRVREVAAALAGLQVPVSVTNNEETPESHPEEMPFDEAFRFLLVVNAINYCYRDASTGVVFADGDKIGAGLLMERVWRHWPYLQSRQALLDMTPQVLARLFAADTPLPALEERAAGLRSVGRFLEKHRGTRWQSFIGTSFGDPLALALHLERDIPAYRGDPFLRRAQLMVGMLIGNFGSKLPATLRRTEPLTVYADYLLPVMAARTGMIRLHPNFEALLQDGEPIDRGSDHDLALRGVGAVVMGDALLAALRSHRPYEKLDILSLHELLAVLCAEDLWPQGLDLLARPDLPEQLTTNDDS